MTLLEHPVALTPSLAEWVPVCTLADLIPERGVCALVAGAPVAIFRAAGTVELFAIGNIDPYSEASVLSRGIVGSAGDRLVVASPVFKQRFDLTTGESLEDAAVQLPVYDIRVVGGIVSVSSAPRTSNGS